MDIFGDLGELHELFARRNVAPAFDDEDDEDEDEDDEDEDDEDDEDGEVALEDEGDDVLIAAGRGGLLGQRPCLVPVGERVGHGRRCGLRRLARCIDVYIDESSRAKVCPGQSVRAGTDVLAILKRKPAEEEAIA